MLGIEEARRRLPSKLFFGFILSLYTRNIFYLLGLGLFIFFAIFLFGVPFMHIVLMCTLSKRSYSFAATLYFILEFIRSHQTTLRAVSYRIRAL